MKPVSLTEQVGELVAMSEDSGPESRESLDAGIRELGGDYRATLDGVLERAAFEQKMSEGDVDPDRLQLHHRIEQRAAEAGISYTEALAQVEGSDH
jgi:hypothetical protein